MDDISKRIKEVYKEHGYKQEFIAEKMGVKQSTLSEKLSNGNDIKYSLILEISEITNIPVVDFITYPDKYVQETISCKSCATKDEIIENLNMLLRQFKKKKGNCK